MVESTRDFNSLSLNGKLMLLLHTLLRFPITAMVVAILMRIFALPVPSLDNIASWLKFDTTSISSPFMVKLALMLFLLLSMILDLSMLTTMRYALALATSGCVRSCSSLLMPPSYLCHVQNGGCRRASHQLEWQCAVR